MFYLMMLLVGRVSNVDCRQMESKIGVLVELD